jgi:hypothetical protein
MKIGYSKRHLIVNLILGSAWFIWFLIQINTKDQTNLSDFGKLGISLLYFGLYIYRRQIKYLSIESGIIKMNDLFGLGKKIKLNEVISIEQFSNGYYLNTNNRDFKINTQIIDSNSLIVLNKELEKLNVMWY